MSKILRVSFTKVAEYQQRGLVHYLAVIRFDGPEGSTAPSLACASADILIQAVQKATDRVALTFESDAVGVRKFGRGKQIGASAPGCGSGQPALGGVRADGTDRPAAR